MTRSTCDRCGETVDGHSFGWGHLSLPVTTNMPDAIGGMRQLDVCTECVKVISEAMKVPVAKVGS